MTAIHPDSERYPILGQRAALVVAGRAPRANAWKKRLLAAANARGNRRHEAAVQGHKAELFGELRGKIVEIGPGAGTNLSCFRRDVAWTGIEPNPYMHRYLRERAKRLGLEIDLRVGRVEDMDVASDSVDAVAGSLVLCSVPDVARALGEVKRVLRPGGRFVFIEHVAADRDTWARRTQKWIAPINRVFGDGCRHDRDIWRDIFVAGFAEVRIERIELPLWLGGPHIAGYAVKR